ncbi:MAG TPA: helix-turn-helix transcriptional regulator [Stellaceae bacterium]|jgi:transcriptional regulator with XRE-family HTH domain|nr:helix-turn-helix transcriptional regulator [Stellaceae bacterium]
MRARPEIIFPNNIKEFRKRRQLTQLQLGRMLKPPIGESAISKIENGERRLTNLQLADLAEILGCKAEDIPVISGRDSISSRNWLKAQQEVIEASIASGAAATGYVLAQLRKKHGKTMQQVATAIGMTLSVYHRVEMASRIIQPQEIDLIAALYAMNSAELIVLFERRTQENLEQLRRGVAAEQLLPRVPRALLKDDAKWGRLGALERYVMRRSIRHVADTGARPDGALVLPVYGAMKRRDDGTHRFVIDRDSAIEHIPLSEFFRADNECFYVRNFSQRLGFLLRPGSLALVDPRAPAALGDIAFIIRRDGSADAGVVTGDGIGPMIVKMFNPEEYLPVNDPRVAEVLRIGMLILA